MIRHIQLSEVDWHGIKDCLPTGDSEYEEQVRSEIWKSFDPNGNGLASLAECDLAIRRLGGPMLPVYYSKKVQLMAFNKAKSSNPGANQTKDDFIEKSELKEFMIWLKKYFSYYYMFKKLDEDNNERLEIYDFISGLMKLRMWGWHVEDVKEARKIFNSYDDNRGGLLLMDEWVKFCEDQNLDIEKDQDIINDSKKQRIVYHQHSFMRGGEKRPHKIDPEAWKNKAPLVDLDKEIQKMMKRNEKLKRPEEFKNKVLMPKAGRSPKDYGKIKYTLFKNTSHEQEAEITYQELEKKIQGLDNENFGLKDELSKLKQELLQMKEIAMSQKVK